MPIILPQITISKGSGRSDLAITGTGTSQPGGLESYFEYNGLLLNNKKNIDTYLILNVDGLADADVRDQRQVNPNYHGETAFNAWYGGRTIALSGRIRAHNVKKLRDMQEALKLSFGVLQELPLIISSNFTTYPIEIKCRKLQPIVMAETQQNRMFTRDFLITLRASDPRFRSLFQTVYEATKIGAAFNPLVVVNKGNHRAQPIITIEGPISGAELTNQNNQEKISFSSSIPEDTIIIIDILKRTIKDQYGENQFHLLGVDSDWLEITPGENILELTGTGISTATNWGISFQDTWL